MKKFKLKDLANGDTIGYYDSLAELRKAAREYDSECECDWIEQIRVLNPDTGKYRIYTEMRC